MTTWNQRILTAKLRGHFLYRDDKAAAAWGSCAISENPRIRHVADELDNRPTTIRADRLGVAFYQAVMTDDFDRALKLLRRIRKL